MYPAQQPNAADNQFIDHPAQAPYSVPGLKVFPDRLYVITVISNPRRYRSRYRLYRAFEHHMAESGVEFFTVEFAFGRRQFEITDRSNPYHVQVRGGDKHEIWLKENLCNIGLSRLPPEAQYIAFVDADLTFARPDWAQETMHQLQHYAAVQMFSHIQYLGPDEEPIHGGKSFMELWKSDVPLRGVFRDDGRVMDYGYGQISKERIKGAYGPPGGAWAYRRATLDKLGGLLDVVIHGGGDHWMCLALLGKLSLYLPKDKLHANFVKILNEWQNRAQRHVRRNIGVVPGLVLHHWHGSRENRGYSDRGQIIVKHQYDPMTDIKRDWQGLIHLEDDGSDRFVDLREALRRYFNSRNEDGTNV